jgi:transposase
MYDHYIALDWAQDNMAIARMTKISDKVTAFEGPTDLAGLRNFLRTLEGSKILMIEECTGSQWLYTELNSEVDKILVCDPHRNRLLIEGPKTDKIDAKKLVRLLRANLVKEVYHSGNDLIHVRKIVSAYTDLVKLGVRLKNQRSAVFRSLGKDHKNDKETKSSTEDFILKGIDRSIEIYEQDKERYEKEFRNLAKKHKVIRLIQDLPGIGPITAVALVAYVVDAKRFRSKGSFLSYCGLIRHDRISGGRSYGTKRPRFCPAVKQVFKIAALAAIQDGRTSFIRDYYLYLQKEKKLSEFDARHAVARRIAVIAYGMLKSEQKFEIGRIKQEEFKNLDH